MTRSILVVDDDERLLNVVKLFFEVKGYEVRTANGGEAALAAVEERRPDAVVLDVMMPDVDGLEVCKRLRSDQRFKRLPIIILTAAPEMEKSSIAAGANRFVSKPFDLDDLAKPVRELLAKTR